MAGLQLHDTAIKEIDTCVHCGLCLPSCPTYKELGQEPDSPRGRIYLVKGLMEGRLAPNDSVLGHLDLCLGCYNCQTACPSGVKYGVILEEARAQLEPARPRSWFGGFVRTLLLRQIVPHPGRLALLIKLARFGQWSGLDRLAPGHFGQLAAALPTLRTRPSRRLLPAEIPGGGPRVGLVLGCIQDVMFPGTNVSTAKVLQRYGCTVAVPQGQTCCGALHAHAGDDAQARDLARKMIDDFAGVDYVCINAAGCGAHMKHFDRLLADDPAYAKKASAFCRKVRDFSELLAMFQAEGKAVPGQVTPAGVAYQDACHLAHGQGVRAEPRQVLGAAMGQAPANLKDEACCGSAGFYNLVQFDMSMAVLDRKMEQVKAAGATLLVTGNPGCLLQLRLGARRHNLDLQVVHIADYLEQAYAAAEAGGHGQEGGGAR